MSFIDKTFGARTGIMLIGDSNMTGSNGDDPSGHVGNIRHAFYHHLRSRRADFDFLGANTSTPELTSTGLWYHAAHTGDKISDATSAFAGHVSASGAPDLIIDMLGTNDIAAGDTLSTMQSRRASLHAEYALRAPGARVLALAVPPFVAGTTTGTNLSTWNSLRASYNSWLAGYCSDSNHRYVDLAGALGSGDFQTDGVHLTRQGGARLGNALAAYFDTPDLLGVAPSGSTLPRSYKLRTYTSAIQFTLGTTDGISVASHSGFNPGSGSYAIEFEYYPTDLSSGTHSVAQYGAYASPSNYWALYQNGRLLSVYPKLKTAGF